MTGTCSGVAKPDGAACDDSNACTLTDTCLGGVCTGNDPITGLAPHRIAFAALARPEMELHDELGRPWPGLTDRLDRAVEAVENLRDLLLGTFDIHMGRAAQDANEVMKVLTLLSAVLLPAVVLAGVMGMNFKLPFFDEAGNFFLVVAAMAVFAIAIILAARWRRWI